MLNADKLRSAIAESGNIVFFGGAGVSTESGIPDFRSNNGIYDAIRGFGYSPEILLSHDFFINNTEVFYRYYKLTLAKTGFKPNAAHNALAKLEALGKLSSVITQNVDGLHQMAGSKCVYELHGSIYRNYCMKCHRFYDIRHIHSSDGVPLCECGGIVKPDVVLYGEQLDWSVVDEAGKSIMDADMMIVGGTSLSVYPAASLVDYYQGDRLFLINKSSTPYDGRADAIINGSIGEIMQSVIRA